MKTLITSISLKMLELSEEYSQNKESEILEIINNLDDIDETDKSGRSLLVSSILYKLNNITEFIIQKGANIYISESNGLSAMHAAVLSNNSYAVKLLLDKNFPINITDKFGNTPLIKVSHQNIELIKLLVDNGADCFIENNFGISAYKAFQAYPEIMRIFNISQNKGCNMKFILSPEQIRKLYVANGEAGCIASNRITVDGMKVGYLYREDPSSSSFPDSGWRFFSGDEDEEYTNDPNNFNIFDLNTICNYDTNIISLLESPIGCAFFRENGKWTIEYI